MEKGGAFRQHLYKEVIKTLDFVSVQIKYLSNCLLTLIQEEKVNSKPFRNTVTYIIKTKILRTTKKSRKKNLESYPKTLDCHTPVNINSDKPASSPSKPTVSIPRVLM